MSQRRVFRRFVLPTAWLLIGALIAVSLVKLAFTGSASAQDDQLYRPARYLPKPSWWKPPLSRTL